jgi:hypothetical protein
VLRRYEQRQLSSAEVVEQLIEIAKRLRDSARRHEELGLTEEEAAFYDALAGGVEHVKADPRLAALAQELVESIRKDLSVDWTDREASEARIRTRSSACCAAIATSSPRTSPQRPTAVVQAEPPTPPTLGSTTSRNSSSTKPRRSTGYWPDVGDRLFDRSLRDPAGGAAACTPLSSCCD